MKESDYIKVANLHRMMVCLETFRMITPGKDLGISHESWQNIMRRLSNHQNKMFEIITPLDEDEQEA